MKKKVILEKTINGKKKWKGGKLGKKVKKKQKSKKRKECTMDYYCNPQCIGYGWTVNSPYPLTYYLINDKKTEPFYNFIISEK